jgi:hypothetical protein
MKYWFSLLRLRSGIRFACTSRIGLRWLPVTGCWKLLYFTICNFVPETENVVRIQSEFRHQYTPAILCNLWWSRGMCRLWRKSPQHPNMTPCQPLGSCRTPSSHRWKRRSCTRPRRTLGVSSFKPYRDGCTAFGACTPCTCPRVPGHVWLGLSSKNHNDVDKWYGVCA